MAVKKTNESASQARQNATSTQTKKQQARKKTTVKKKTTRKKIAKKVITATITLDPVLGIADAAELKRILLEKSAQTGTIVIDAHAVQMIDTAALQLIVAFFLELQGRQQEVKVLNPSDVFTDTVALLGLTTTLK